MNQALLEMVERACAQIERGDLRAAYGTLGSALWAARFLRQLALPGDKPAEVLLTECLGIFQGAYLQQDSRGTWRLQK